MRVVSVSWPTALISGMALARNTAVHQNDFTRWASRLNAGLLDRPRKLRAERLAEVFARMTPALERRLERLAANLDNLDKLRRSFNPDGPLQRGFARVHRADGSLARSAKALAAGEGVKLVFADGDRGAVVDGTAAPRSAKTKAPPPGQGSLF